MFVYGKPFWFLDPETFCMEKPVLRINVQDRHRVDAIRE